MNDDKNEQLGRLNVMRPIDPHSVYTPLAKLLPEDITKIARAVLWEIRQYEADPEKYDDDLRKEANATMTAAGQFFRAGKPDV